MSVIKTRHSVFTANVCRNSYRSRAVSVSTSGGDQLFTANKRSHVNSWGICLLVLVEVAWGGIELPTQLNLVTKSGEGEQWLQAGPDGEKGSQIRLGYLFLSMFSNGRVHWLASTSSECGSSLAPARASRMMQTPTRIIIRLELPDIKCAMNLETP
ncbi:hypothetical protein RRG08_021117 [Elysia crispata]|uniref:Uncharacterized protein n=1 Tax=Elysia crispata TaxID=231223 RepID=A0AAE0Z5K2_9GAST|nr:hypothetical protein RRG08_021117 [Elysia crispata]